MLGWRSMAGRPGKIARGNDAIALVTLFQPASLISILSVGRKSGLAAGTLLDNLASIEVRRFGDPGDLGCDERR
jgi:hypothetical protein